MVAEGTVTAGGSVPADVPYLPSWTDHLIRAIERLPGPPWVIYALMLVPLIVVANAVSWTAGDQEYAPGIRGYAPGTFSLLWTGFAVYPVYIVALIHYLNTVAVAKLDAFRPALEADQRQYDRLRYELTTLPAREGALAGLAGFGFVAFVFGGDVILDGLGRFPLAYAVGEFVLQAVTFALLAVLIYHTIHQLRLVSRIHALAPRIDLFQPAPLYAFSHLTARTGLGLATLVAISFVFDPTINPIGVGLSVAVVGLAAAAFVLPLEGMHGRIVVEKERLQLEVNRRLKTTLAQLHQSVDERDLSQADDLNKTLESLQLERDAIAKMSTWPWEPGTLRAFVSVLLVPIVLWLIFRVLDRFI